MKQFCADLLCKVFFFGFRLPFGFCGLCIKSFFLAAFQSWGFRCRYLSDLRFQFRNRRRRSWGGGTLIIERSFGRRKKVFGCPHIKSLARCLVRKASVIGDEKHRNVRIDLIAECDSQNLVIVLLFFVSFCTIGFGN